MSTTGTIGYVKTITGTQVEEGKKIIADSDGMVYGLASSTSAELTNSNSQNVILIRFAQDGSSINYFKTFGGTGVDVPTNMEIHGVYLYISGYSTQIGTSATQDSFVV